MLKGFGDKYLRFTIVVDKIDFSRVLSFKLYVKYHHGNNDIYVDKTFNIILHARQYACK